MTRYLMSEASVHDEAAVLLAAALFAAPCLVFVVVFVAIVAGY